MSDPRKLVIAILITICLTGGIQRKYFDGSLKTTRGDILAERDGKIVLVRSNDVAFPDLKSMMIICTTWQISAPYLQTRNSRFLAMDETKDTLTLYLAEKSSDSAKWVIEVLQTIKPQEKGKGTYEGQSGSKFRLSVFGGKSKGWYLAADEATDEQKKGVPSDLTVTGLKLVQDPKQALVFDYAETRYSIHHK